MDVLDKVRADFIHLRSELTTRINQLENATDADASVILRLKSYRSTIQGWLRDLQAG